MTEIADVLVQISLEAVALEGSLTAATAQGAQAGSVAAATRAAAAQIQALTARIQGDQARVEAAAPVVSAAIAARKIALASFESERAAGAPLAEPEAKALKKAVAGANAVDETDLESKGVTAVSTIDSEIAAIGGEEEAELEKAKATLAAKQQALEAAAADASGLLALIKGKAAEIADQLARAKAAWTLATAKSAAADVASHLAAAVAYADYAAARDSLSSDAKTDPHGNNAQKNWDKAAVAWLTALADVATAEKEVIKKQLALADKLAEQAAKLQTRDADAATAVERALAGHHIARAVAEAPEKAVEVGAGKEGDNAPDQANAAGA